jgi:branched-chain amino acid transport system substrate-binding protein
VGTVLLPACGGNEPETVRIGVIAPLTGALSASGLGIRDGVDLAVDQANGRHRVKGWRIVLVSEDDTAVPNVGANAATRMSDDPSVMAVVGPLNSSVAETAAPILDSHKVVMISPANTDPTLTRGTDPRNSARTFAGYFRVAATDLVQGPFAAGFAYQSAGKHDVVVVHDRTAYGQSLALGFKARFEKLGGRVPTVETVDPEGTDFTAVLSRIKRFSPEMIYFGGEYPAAARLRSQADQQNIKVPLMGGYGIFDPAYFTLAGAAAVGDFATSVGAAADELPAARPFVDAYRAAGYSDPPSAYGAYAYDAANVIVAALAKVLPGAGRITDDLRARFRRAVQDGTVDGATGPVAFDRYGDTTTRSLTVYEVKQDASRQMFWSARQTSQISASSWE